MLSAAAGFAAVVVAEGITRADMPGTFSTSDNLLQTGQSEPQRVSPDSHVTHQLGMRVAGQFIRHGSDSIGSDCSSRARIWQTANSERDESANITAHESDQDHGVLHDGLCAFRAGSRRSGSAGSSSSGRSGSGGKLRLGLARPVSQLGDRFAEQLVIHCIMKKSCVRW